MIGNDLKPFPFNECRLSLSIPAEKLYNVMTYATNEEHFPMQTPNNIRQN